jgi:hypothetical protein
VEERGDTAWCILYDHEDGEWVIDEEMTELVIAPED